MRPLAGSFTANDEIDGAEWLGVPAARGRLTYPHDRVVLDAFAAFAG